MMTAHVNEAGIVLRFNAPENLPSQSWVMLLDQLKSEHIPGLYQDGRRSIATPGIGPDMTKVTIYFTPKMVTIDQAKEILHHWGFEVHEDTESN